LASSKITLSPGFRATPGEGGRFRASVEALSQSVIKASDSDGDGMPDEWELDQGLDPHDSWDANYDYDEDGLTNLMEYSSQTDIWEYNQGSSTDPVPSVTIDRFYNGQTFVVSDGQSLVRPHGGVIALTVRFKATDADGNLAGIKPSIWHPDSNADAYYGYVQYYNDEYGYWYDVWEEINPNDEFLDDNNGQMVGQFGREGEVVKTIYLDRDGDWYFWSTAADHGSPGVPPVYRDSGAWTDGFKISVAQGPSQNNHAPVASVEVEGQAPGATLVRPYGKPVTVTVRYKLYDEDGNITAIRPQAWHEGTNYLQNDNGNQTSRSACITTEIVRTYTLDRDGDWYFWTDGWDSVLPDLINSGAFTSGYKLTVQQAAQVPNAEPQTSVECVQYQSESTVYRGSSAPVTITIRYRATDSDGNLNAIRGSRYYHNENYDPDYYMEQWDDGVSVPASGPRAEREETVTLDSDGVWYFWTQAQDTITAPAWTNNSGTPPADALVLYVQSWGSASPVPSAPTLTGAPASIQLGQSISLNSSTGSTVANLAGHRFWRRGPRTSDTFHEGSHDWVRDGENSAGWVNLPNPIGSPSGSQNSTRTVSFTPPQPGFWQFAVDAVNDQNGLSPRTMTDRVFVAPLPSVNLVASTPQGASANGGGTLQVTAGQPVSITSTTTASGWLSTHAIGRVSGQSLLAFVSKNLSAEATKTSNTESYTWTPTEPGSYTLYTSASTGPNPGAIAWAVDGTAAAQQITVNVLPENGAEFVSMNVPSSVTAGAYFTATITLRNTGHTTWSAAANHSLGSQTPENNAIWGISRVPVAGAIAPGATQTFTFQAQAPATPASHAFHWRMVQDGVEWFGATTPGRTITVVPASAQDADGDQLSDSWELQYFGGTSSTSGSIDSDHDGVSNLAEYYLGKNPTVADTAPSGMSATLPAGWAQLNASDTSRAEAVGMTPGQLSVSPSGAATYSVAIAVTPGTAGMEPKLSINYGSQGGAGLIGYGWSLGGLSAISRSPATLIHDEKIDGIDFDADDRFSLDGQRLIAISGTYGANGTEYRTEIDSFSRIVSYGTAGNGPAWFKVWTKAGLIIEYGNSTDSAFNSSVRSDIISWSVNRISDTSGNYMEFRYSEDTVQGSQRLERINYTGNSLAGSWPYASVRFTYEDRPDPARGYLYGCAISATKRLTAIKSYHGETCVRTYTLGYAQRAYTSRSLLVSLTETGKDGKSYPPLTFEYSNPPVGWDSQPKWAPPQQLAGRDNFGMRPGRGTGFVDLNGDGRADFVRYYHGGTHDYTVNSRTGTHVLRSAYLNDPVQGWVYDARFILPLGYPLATDSTSFATTPSTRLVDINGDGFVDVGNRESVFRLGSAAGFSATPSVRWNLPWHPSVPAEAEQRELNANFHLVDINGDGLLDYVGGGARYYRTYQEYNYDTSQYEDREEDFGYFPNVWINNGPGPEVEGAGWTPANAAYALPPSVTTHLGVRLLDLNGDGLVDIVRHWQNSTNNTTYKAIVLNTGTGWNELTPGSEEFTRLLPRELFSVGKNIGYWEDNASIGTELTDLNGDGLVDILRRYEEYPYAGNKAYFNTGNGWADAPQNYQLPIALASNYRPSGAAFLDIDSDGLIDCLHSFDASIRSVWLGAGTLGWSVPTAAGYAPPRQIMQSGSPAHATGTDFVDVNADGAIDQVWNWAQPGQYTANASINRRVNPDRLTKVTSGLGVSATIEYAPLTATEADGEPTLYKKGTNAVYPVVDIIAPMQVVKAISNDDGVGGQYRQVYQYENYRAHAQRGSLGFEFMSVFDTRTRILGTTQYSQIYPFVGMPVKTTTEYVDESGNGTTLSESTTTYGEKLLNAGKTRFVFPRSSEQKSFNFDTTAPLDVLTESVTVTDRNNDGADYDNYGNSLYLSVTTTGAGGVQPHSKVTTSIYENITDLPSQSGTSRWYLGRLTASSVTATSPTDSQTRSSSFTYENSTTGLLKTETIEPGNSALSLTTTYGYDSFGNKTTVVTSGTGVASRSASTTYDTQGRFPQRTLNALAHEETYVYDPALGVLKSTTGPNGLTTSWEYDGFARKTKETRADGTVSLMHYRWTAAPTVINGIPSGAVYHIETESSGAPPAIAFYDRFGRTIAARSLNGGGLDGIPRIVGSETYFDSMGRAYRSSLLHYLDAQPSEISYTETFNYDALGRPRTVSTPTDSGGVAYSHVAYDGFTTQTTNPNGQVERVVRNAQGQVVERINNATAAANSDERGRVTFTYDAYGQLLTTVVHKNDSVSHTTTLEYDARGRKKKMIDPDMGTWEYGYNVFGELIWQKDAKLQYTEMEYDVLGRLINRKEYTSMGASDPVVTSWTYDTAAGASLGKLHTVVTTGATYNKSVGNNETYTYDSLGRPANVTRLINGRSFTSGQTYDTLGRPQYTIYPSGFQTKNVYSTLGFLREVRRADNSQNELYWAADSYALDGRVNGEYYGNGLSTDRVYNQRTGRLEMVHSGIGADARAQYLRYTYDDLGNVLSRADEALKRSETFVYDGLNRLTSHTALNIASNATTTVTVAYDSLGNIRQKSDVGTYLYNTLNNPRPHAVSETTGGSVSSSYYYDGNGNMTSGGGRTYSWTLDNKPWRIEQGVVWSEFTFDSSRQRTTQKTNLGSTTYYVGGAYEEVRSGANDSTLVERKHYIMAPTGRVAVRVEKASGSIVETRWFHQDGLGSINAISKETGEIAQRFAYDAWGKRVNGENGSSLTSSNNQGLTRGYTDHEHLEDLGLIHMNGRVFDPAFGRFQSSDIIVDSLGDSQSYNRYSYVNNNPLGYTDPSGYRKLRDAFKHSLFLGPHILGDPGYWFAEKQFNQYYGQASGIAIGVVATYFSWNPYAGAAAAGAYSGFATSLLNGGSLGDAFKAGAIGAAFGVVTAGIGQTFTGVSGTWYGEIGRAIAHGTASGIYSEVSGGDFRHGFYSGFSGSIMGSIAGKIGPGYSDRSIGAIAQRTALAAVAGGTASVLGGGKFANGAITAAFQHLFNAEHELPSNEIDSTVELGIYDSADPGGGALTDGRASGKNFEAAAKLRSATAHSVSSEDELIAILTKNPSVKYKSIGFFGHGNTEGAYINGKKISNSTIKLFASRLSGDGKMYFYTCDIAKSKALLVYSQKYFFKGQTIYGPMEEISHVSNYGPTGKVATGEMHTRSDDSSKLYLRGYSGEK
jgi:RHS repeat-associated protein